MAVKTRTARGGPKAKRLLVSLTEAEHWRLGIMAEAKGVSMSKFLADLLWKEFDTVASAIGYSDPAEYVSIPGRRE